MARGEIRLATFSTVKTLVLIFCVVCFCIAVAYVLLQHPTDQSLESFNRSRGGMGYEKVMLGLSCITLLLLQQIGLLILLISGRPAVWLSNGQICYVNAFSIVILQSLSWGDVQSLAIKESAIFSHSGILLGVAGGKRLIPTWLFVEAPEIILASLQENLGGGVSCG